MVVRGRGRHAVVVVVVDCVPVVRGGGGGGGRGHAVAAVGHVLKLDYEPVAGRVLEPVQLLLGVGGGLRIVEDNVAERFVVLPVSALSVVGPLELAVVEAGHEVEQPPELVLVDERAGDDGEAAVAVGVGVAGVHVAQHVVPGGHAGRGAGAGGAARPVHPVRAVTLVIVGLLGLGVREHWLERSITIFKCFGRVGHSVILDVGEPLALLGGAVPHDAHVVHVPELVEVVPQLRLCQGFGHDHEEPDQPLVLVHLPPAALVPAVGDQHLQRPRVAANTLPVHLLHGQRSLGGRGKFYVCNSFGSFV